MVQNTNRSRKGGNINIPIPLVGQVCIEDIAWRLSNICRFNGYVREFFCVGQHGLEVSMLCYQEAKRFNVHPAKAGLAGLLHDTPEYAYGDIINPVKHHLGPEFKAMRKEADANVFEALGVTKLMAECHDLVRWADLEMLISDAARWDCFGTYDLLDGPAVIDKHNVVPPPFQLRFNDAIPYAPGQSYAPFLQAYFALKESVDKLPKFVLTD